MTTFKVKLSHLRNSDASLGHRSGKHVADISFNGRIWPTTED